MPSTTEKLLLFIQLTQRFPHYYLRGKTCQELLPGPGGWSKEVTVDPVDGSKWFWAWLLTSVFPLAWSSSQLLGAEALGAQQGCVGLAFVGAL